MTTVNIDGIGEVRLLATLNALAIYEQNFDGADMIADVFGRQRASDDGGSYVIDFTQDNWMAVARAVWALSMNDWAIRDKNGDATRNEKPKPFKQWLLDVGAVNIRELSFAVVTEALDGFFHDTSDGGEEGQG